ncbi:MAG: M18 family aminopeptidase [Lachnospiraceae bacterium]|nr:M18 family aminopeptidase [Lachnospiraceae bacterium]
MDEFYRESESLLRFIEKSPSCFHVVKNAASQLAQKGFERLWENQKWDLRPGGAYYVTRNGSSLIAFRIPEQPFEGFQLVCSHTDSPTFKVKMNPEMEADKKYTKLNVEKYGGMLCAPWFDRPLSVAGRILVRSGNEIRQELVNVDRDLLMIPNVAIHMNRTVNEGYAYNAQVDLCPVFGDEQAMNTFDALIAETAGIQKEQILGTDLFLYNRQKGTFWGSAEEFIASPRLDDLQCLYASLQGFLAAEQPENAAVFCAFDNEETGSVSRQGAASTFLQDTLKRINYALGNSEEDYLRLTAGSFMLSADNAHAVHPNHQEMADPVNRPQMNHGIVIKYNANQKYTTDGVSAAVFGSLCKQAEVPFQTFTNRSDMAGGSTLGNISNTQVSMRCVDIGLAQLAMHSPYEMAGGKDALYLKRVSELFYRTMLRVTEDGIAEVCAKY